MHHNTELLSHGMRHYKEGRLDAAEAVCQNILDTEPECADAYYILGLLSQRKQELENACACLRKATALKPESTLYHHTLGNLLLETGDAALAYDSFQRTLELDPRHAAAHFGTAIVLQQAGHYDEAETEYTRALETKPDFLEALCNLGAVMYFMGKLDKAVDNFLKALALNPDNAMIHYSLATAYQTQQRTEEATNSFREALRIKPDLVEAHFNLGILLRDQGDLTGAMECFRMALSINPRLAEAYSNLGNIANLAGDAHRAIEYYRKAVDFRQDYPDAYNNLGIVLMNSGDFTAAIVAFRSALKYSPDNPKINFNLGICHKESARYTEAIRYLDTALKLDPGINKAYAELCRINQIICAWHDDAHPASRLIEINRSCLEKNQESPVYPFDALSLPITPAEQTEIANSHAAAICRKSHISGNLFNQAYPEHTGRLRIGYISPNFNNHAEAHLTAGLYGSHDRDKFEIFAYSIGHDDGSVYRQRITQGCEHFTDIRNHSYQDAAGCIAGDGINILIDLAVYNTNSRPEILALRPAPVLVNYLGFPGSSGADFYDYIITDKVVTPPDQQQWYTEKFVYLPHCYQVNDQLQPAPDHIPSKSDCGLPEQAFVFCSFNNSYKVEPIMFAVWMRILARVPDSVLWLLHHSPEASGNLHNEAASHGIDPSRIVFADKQSKDSHLARHRHADVFLDTLYYNAHTTASDALRAGVPVITSIGTTFASRVAASQLTTMKLTELIASDLREYEELGVRLAKEPQYLAEIRHKLNTNLQTSPLFDTVGFTRSLERSYEMMWAIFTSGAKQQQIVVPG